jgi:hypothetical protein
MNVQSSMSVTQEAALAALREYKQHRAIYDKRDWEIERIYRQIAKGKTVISVADAIRAAGVDEKFRPKLALGRADMPKVRYQLSGGSGLGTFDFPDYRPRIRWRFEVPRMPNPGRWVSCSAIAPRIPPQHRPHTKTLSDYHILWEAEWTDIPKDPYLLKRIGKDAWVVLAAWDLTEVEVSVLRAHATH